MPFRKPPISMWAEACNSLDRAERLRRQFFQPGRIASWEPPVDVFETEGDLWVTVALPGVRIDQLQVAVSGGTIVIAGERRLPIQSRAAILRLEIPHGRFERRIELPAGHYELSRSDLADGCLILRLRKLN
jgi:HSP20 family protein